VDIEVLRLHAAPQVPPIEDVFLPRQLCDERAA
jgi:hypothetical protein